MTRLANRLARVAVALLTIGMLSLGAAPASAQSAPLVKRNVLPSGGGAALFEGRFLETAPNATGQGDAFYGYTEVTWTF